MFQERFGVHCISISSTISSTCLLCRMGEEMLFVRPRHTRYDCTTTICLQLNAVGNDQDASERADLPGCGSSLVHHGLCSSNEDISSTLQKRQSKTPLSTAACFTMPLTSSALGIGMRERPSTHYIQEQYRRIVCCGWIERFVWMCESGDGVMFKLVASARYSCKDVHQQVVFLFLRHSLLL